MSARQLRLEVWVATARFWQPVPKPDNTGGRTHVRTFTVADL